MWKRRKTNRSNKIEPRPFPDIQVEIDRALVDGVVDKLRTVFHPGPVTGEIPAGRKLSDDELQLITAAYVYGVMDSYHSDKVRQTLDGMLDRASFDEAVHLGNFGYFTRENVDPEIVPALERAYQLVADYFAECNEIRVRRSSLPNSD